MDIFLLPKWLIFPYLLQFTLYAGYLPLLWSLPQYLQFRTYSFETCLEHWLVIRVLFVFVSLCEFLRLMQLEFETAECGLPLQHGTFKLLYASLNQFLSATWLWKCSRECLQWFYYQNVTQLSILTKPGFGFEIHNKLINANTWCLHSWIEEELKCHICVAQSNHQTSLLWLQRRFCLLPLHI